MGNPRKKPEKLPAKLLAIRHKLEVSQSQMAKLLELETGYPRISEYEIGKREPDLIVLLRYAKLARVSMNVLANDNLELKFPQKLEKAKTRNLQYPLTWCALTDGSSKSLTAKSLRIKYFMTSTLEPRRVLICR